MSDLLAGFHSISNRCKNYYWTVTEFMWA